MRTATDTATDRRCGDDDRCFPDGHAAIDTGARRPDADGCAAGRPCATRAACDVAYERRRCDHRLRRCRRGTAATRRQRRTVRATLRQTPMRYGEGTVEACRPMPEVDADGGIHLPRFASSVSATARRSCLPRPLPVFIEERGWDGPASSARRSRCPPPLPARTRPLTLSGIATSEGALSLSLDGRYLALAGYATAPGRASVAISTNVERIVARVDAAGTVDTTTSLGDAFSGSNARSAASVDGTAFWIGGSSGGVWYASLGGTGLTQIVSSPDNVRLVATLRRPTLRMLGDIADDDRIHGRQRPAHHRHSRRRCSAGHAAIGHEPLRFRPFRSQPDRRGLDTLYLTDDRSPESDGSGGGVQKWTFDGSAWTRVATFAAVGGGSASFRGVTGTVTAGGVTLVASTAESNANRLVVFVDEGSSDVTGTVIATAPSNTIFRGVALSPRP